VAVSFIGGEKLQIYKLSIFIILTKIHLKNFFFGTTEPIGTKIWLNHNYMYLYILVIYFRILFNDQPTSGKDPHI
jgi:hypothetical protein